MKLDLVELDSFDVAALEWAARNPYGADVIVGIVEDGVRRRSADPQVRESQRHKDRMNLAYERCVIANDCTEWKSYGGRVSWESDDSPG